MAFGQEPDKGGGGSDVGIQLEDAEILAQTAQQLFR